jgi:hypothetical protein
MIVEQAYTSERGRRRRRQVRVDLAEVRQRLGLPGPDDRADWEQIRSLLLGAVGEDMFVIWLEPVELIAISDDGALVVSAPSATRSWVSGRYGPLLSARAEAVGRELRFADEPERVALGSDLQRRPGSARGGLHQSTGGVVT